MGGESTVDFGVNSFMKDNRYASMWWLSANTLGGDGEACVTEGEGASVSGICMFRVRTIG